MTIVRSWLEASGGDCGLAMSGHAKLGPPPIVATLGLRDSNNSTLKEAYLYSPHHARAVSVQSAELTLSAPTLMMQPPGGHECSSRLGIRSACS